MTTPVKTTLIIISVLSAGAVGVIIGRHGATAKHDDAAATQPADDNAAEKKPTATVQTVPIRRGEISQLIRAYGSVTAEPGEVAVMSVPFESRVRRVVVTGGQQVAAGDVLLNIEPSADTQTQLIDAKNALAASDRDLEQVKQRFESHLGTNAELSLAEQTRKNAQVKLDSLQSRGAGSPQEVKAEGAGVISKVDVQDGQIVAAGAPMIEIAVENRIAVKLGIEPELLANLQAGQAVSLRSVSGASEDPVHGTVRLITQRVNPDTRLVDVFVSLPSNAGLVLEQFVRGEMETQTKQALLVPKAAVLPEDETHRLFTVKNGHAVEHKVSVGLQDDKSIEVSGEGIAEGDPVVVVGNYELEDGMQVEVNAEGAAEATSQPEIDTASTQPTTGPTTAPGAEK